MRKRVFIPTVVMGQEKQGDLLELSVDSGSFFSGDSFKPLRGCHLESAIDIAHRVLQSIPKPKQKSSLYLVNPTPYLSNSKGAGLGLVLAVFMREKQCPHQTLIVTGLLDNKEKQDDMIITDGGNLDLRLSAALSLGQQSEETPFVIPAGVDLDRDAVRRLAQLKIFVCPAHTLCEALDYCLAPIPKQIVTQKATI